MNTTPILIGHEASMRRSFGSRHAREDTPFERRGLTLPEQPLPPTRAARPPRSRGVFFGIAYSRLGHWAVNLLCIVLAAVGIGAVARFAEPVLDARFVTSNAGPGLVASAMHASILIPVRPH